MKKLLILSLAVNALVIGFIIYKKVRVAPAGNMLSASYASNPQYDEQLNIVSAYKAPCDIALIGDSHIYKCHWDELLGFPVCNRGIGSDITEGVFNRLGTVIRSGAKVCFIMSGSNDIERKIPLDSTVNYFRQIVTRLKENDIKPVIMLSTPVAGHYPNSVDWNAKLDQLNKRLIPLAETISIEIAPGDLQEDGIHLTAAGYLKWKESIVKYLQNHQ